MKKKEKKKSNKKRKMYETCSKLTIKAAEQHSGVPIVSFEQISRIVLVFSLLTLTEEINLDWVKDPMYHL